MLVHFVHVIKRLFFEFFNCNHAVLFLFCAATAVVGEFYSFHQAPTLTHFVSSNHNNHFDEKNVYRALECSILLR